jgi:hypothetical protein
MLLVLSLRSRERLRRRIVLPRVAACLPTFSPFESRAVTFSLPPYSQRATVPSMYIPKYNLASKHSASSCTYRKAPQSLFAYLLIALSFGPYSVKGRGRVSATSKEGGAAAGKDESKVGKERKGEEKVGRGRKGGRVDSVSDRMGRGKEASAIGGGRTVKHERHTTQPRRDSSQYRTRSSNTEVVKQRHGDEWEDSSEDGAGEGVGGAV